LKYIKKTAELNGPPPRGGRIRAFGAGVSMLPKKSDQASSRETEANASPGATDKTTVTGKPARDNEEPAGLTGEAVSS